MFCIVGERVEFVLLEVVSRRLELPERPDDELPMNVVVQSASGPVSLLVDRIGDVIEVDESMYEPVPETYTGAAKDFVRGVYKLGDRLLLDLDVDATIDILGNLAVSSV